MTRVSTVWSPGQPGIDSLDQPRHDIVLEQAEGDGVFTAAEGPFTSYRRTVVPSADGHGTVDTVDYHLAVPWFGWLYWLPMRRALRRHASEQAMPWWSPPDRLDQRAASVMGLLAAAALIVGYVNTLFTQTVAFAATEFHVSKSAQGNAGSIVRAGIVLTLPLVFLADRWGRRRAMVVAAFAAPSIAMLGALAPSFAVLTATQTVARPLGLALDILIAVVAAEEMPRSSRAYAVSVLTMASGLGAGLAVMALKLADFDVSAWRWIYALAAVLLVVAVDLARRLPETRRFIAPHAVAPRYNRSRYRLLLTSAFFANIFVAPASFYQNLYLKEVRHFSGGRISLFTLTTSTPIGLGILVGGRLADTRGRRLVGAVAVTLGAALLIASFAVGGWPMWTSGALGGIVSGAAVPTLVVYRTELFPTSQRGRAGGLITASALVGGTIGLQIAGRLLDRQVGYGPIMAGLGSCELVVAALVLLRYPETAHLELEELNPEDQRG